MTQEARAAAIVADLSERERQIVGLWLKGWSYAGIGARLGITAGAVGCRITTMREKFARHGAALERQNAPERRGGPRGRGRHRIESGVGR